MAIYTITKHMISDNYVIDINRAEIARCNMHVHVDGIKDFAKSHA